MFATGDREGRARMGNSGQLRFDVWTTWPDAETPEPGRRTILCPALRGLPPEDALTLAILPIHDANGLLLDAIARSGAGPVPDYAGVCLSDPFRRMEDVLAAVLGAGIAGIVNMPTAAVIAGPADDGPFSQLCDREMAMLARAGDAGLRALRLEGHDLWDHTGHGGTTAGPIGRLDRIR